MIKNVENALSQGKRITSVIPGQTINNKVDRHIALQDMKKYGNHILDEVLKIADADSYEWKKKIEQLKHQIK